MAQSTVGKHKFVTSANHAVLGRTDADLAALPGGRRPSLQVAPVPAEQRPLNDGLPFLTKDGTYAKPGKQS